MNMTDKIFQVMVPEETIEVTDKKGKEKTKGYKAFSRICFR